MKEQQGAITEWLDTFFSRCLFRGHKWNVHEQIDVFDTSYGARPEHPYKRKYVMRCTNCGDMMVRTTEA